MSLAVVDASVVTAFYATDSEDARREVVTARLAAGDQLVAPAHLDAEVVSALRGLGQGIAAVRTAGSAAVRHLAGLPIRRMPLAPLLARMWELRENVTAYDAAYVALAERLGAPLITADARLAAAHGPRCTFDLIT